MTGNRMAEFSGIYRIVRKYRREIALLFGTENTVVPLGQYEH